MGVTFKPEKKSNSGVKFTPENPDTPITNKYQDYFEPKEIDLEEDETSFPQALNLGAQQGLTAFHADELKDKLYNYLLKEKVCQKIQPIFRRLEKNTLRLKKIALGLRL